MRVKAFGLAIGVVALMATGAPAAHAAPQDALGCVTTFLAEASPHHYSVDPNGFVIYTPPATITVNLDGVVFIAGDVYATEANAINNLIACLA